MVGIESASSAVSVVTPSPHTKQVLYERGGTMERESFGCQAEAKKRNPSRRRSSKKGRKGNALALRADEGRDKLRKASGRSKYP